MITIVLNNRDIYHNVKDSVEFFLTVPDTQILLVDNASTYPPLLEWYDEIEQNPARWPITLHRSEINGQSRHGMKVLYKLREEQPERWVRDCYDSYFMADPDVEYKTLPPEFLAHLRHGLGRWCGFAHYNGCGENPKVPHGAGIGLRIDDLPEDTPDLHRILFYESQFWQEPWTGDSEDWFLADCDTAGVLRWPNFGFHSHRALRSRRYVARHLPWYHTDANRPEDFQYYLDHCNPDDTFFTRRTVGHMGTWKDDRPAIAEAWNTPAYVEGMRLQLEWIRNVESAKWRTK